MAAASKPQHRMCRSGGLQARCFLASATFTRRCTAYKAHLLANKPSHSHSAFVSTCALGHASTSVRQQMPVRVHRTSRYQAVKYIADAGRVRERGRAFGRFWIGCGHRWGRSESGVRGYPRALPGCPSRQHGGACQVDLHGAVCCS